MIYCETGLQPLVYSIKCRMLHFWSKLVTGKSSKLLCIMLRILLNDSVLNYEHEWINQIESIFKYLGLSNIWNSRNVANINWFHHTVKLRLSDQVRQAWISTINDSTKFILYRCFKATMSCEKIFNLPVTSKSYYIY